MVATPDATISNPTHPVTLETQDAATKLGLILVGPSGQKDLTGMSRAPFPRTGLKISQQETQYADEELPYVTSHQDDFSGGRGAEKFEADKTRLADEYRCETRFPNVAFPGAQDVYTTGTIVQQAINWFTDANRNTVIYDLTSANARFARKFTASATEYVNGITLMLDTRALTGTITVAIYSHNAVDDQPNAAISGTASGTLTAAQARHGAFVYHILLAAANQLTSGTVYWIVISCSNATADLVYDNDSGKTGKIKTSSDGGSTWAALPGDLYFRLAATPTSPKSLMFTYRGAWYALMGSALYISGDRGVADASTITVLTDATKSWATNEFVGGVLYLYTGLQAGEYRPIVSNTGTTITVTPGFTTAPDTTDEYVILGANTWRSALTFSGTAEDFTIAGNVLYIARGYSYPILRYRAYNNRGVFADGSVAEAYYAHHVLATLDSALRRWYLWTDVASGRDYDIDHYYGSAVRKFSVPLVFAALYREAALITPADDAWDAYLDLNSAAFYSDAIDDQLIMNAVASSSGVLWFYNLDNPVDLYANGGQALAMAVLANAAASAGDLKLLLSDDDNVGFGKPAMVYYDASDYRRRLDSVDQAASSIYHNDMFTAPGTTHRLYIGAPRRFNSIAFTFISALNNNASVVTVKAFTRDPTVGWRTVSSMTDGTAVAGATMGQNGAITFTMPSDWEKGVDLNSQESGWNATGTGDLNDAPTNYYWVYLTFSAALDDIRIFEITLDDTSATPGAPVSIDFPALTANAWTWATFTLPKANHLLRRVKSIGIKYSVAATTDLYINGGVKLIGSDPEYRSIQSQYRITKLVAYGAEKTNPWVITEGEIFEIQTQNADSVVKLPLEELATLASPDMGADAVANDVYLYFTLGKRIQRYHEGLLENIGPDLDSGLPDTRKGKVIHLLSIPGGSVGAVIEPESNTGDYSLLVRKNGWHEVYRAPMSNGVNHLAVQITGSGVQEVPGIGTRLWIALGDSILWLNFPLSESEANKNYLYGSSITTPWISASFLDVSKRLMALKLYTENLDAATYSKIYAYYQLESGELDTGWTELSSFYTGSPFQDVTIASNYGAAARRVRFKFFFYVGSFDVTIKLRAWILGALLALDVRYMYTLRVLISDNPEDLTGAKDTATRAETIQGQLETWVASPPTVLTMRSMYSTMDNKKVIVMPFPFKPYAIVSTGGEELLVADVQLLEVV